MPDEPSGVFAVIVATVLGSVILAGLVVLICRWFA